MVVHTSGSQPLAHHPASSLTPRLTPFLLAGKNVGYHSPNDPETQTPNMNALVKEGIELDRHYTHLMCSPTRSSLQTGRLPIHVNAQNEETGVHNPADENSGYAGIPLGMTGIAQKLAAGGYATSMAGKVRLQGRARQERAGSQLFTWPACCWVCSCSHNNPRTDSGTLAWRRPSTLLLGAGTTPRLRTSATQVSGDFGVVCHHVQHITSRRAPARPPSCNRGPAGPPRRMAWLTFAFVDLFPPPPCSVLLEQQHRGRGRIWGE